MTAYLTTAEVALRLRTSESTIRYWRMTGYLPIGIAFGRKVLYDDAELAAWERQRAAEAAEVRAIAPAASRIIDSRPGAAGTARGVHRHRGRGSTREPEATPTA